MFVIQSIVMRKYITSLINSIYAGLSLPRYVFSGIQDMSVSWLGDKHIKEYIKNYVF